MQRKLNVFMFFSLSLLISYGAGCQDTGSFAISAKGGTLGLGGELSAGLASDINARVGLNTLDYDIDDEEIDDVEYDLGVELNSLSALLDWHIFDDPFHITGGFISMNSKIDLEARGITGRTEKIGDVAYDWSQIGTLDGSIDVDGLAPYLGIGWGNPIASNRRWGFTFDIGVAFIDSPEVELYSVGGTASSNTAFLAELEKERKEIEDDWDSFKYYPVIQLGLFVRF